MKYIAFDVETTGLEPGSRLVELAAIAFDENGVIDKFALLVNPGMPMPEDTGKINGIVDRMLEDKPNAGESLKLFFDWLPNNTMVAHNTRYDTGIISYEAGRFGLEIPEELIVVDTCEIAKSIGETKNNKLVTLSDHHELIRMGDYHRALSDADLCRQLFLLYKKMGISENQKPWTDAGHNYAYSDDFPEHLTHLPELVSKAMPLIFSYKDAKGHVTKRTITPYGWASTSKGLMFHGLCSLRKARRTFLADRVIEVIQKDGVAA